MKNVIFKEESLENTPQLMEPTPLFNFESNSTYQESHRWLIFLINVIIGIYIVNLFIFMRFITFIFIINIKI